MQISTFVTPLYCFTKFFKPQLKLPVFVNLYLTRPLCLANGLIRATVNQMVNLLVAGAPFTLSALHSSSVCLTSAPFTPMLYTVPQRLKLHNYISQLGFCNFRLSILVPMENVATIADCASVIEGVSRSRNALLNGDTKNYDWDSGYTCHQLGSGAIVVQLAQPYMIGSIRNFSEDTLLFFALNIKKGDGKEGTKMYKVLVWIFCSEHTVLIACVSHHLLIAHFYLALKPFEDSIASGIASLTFCYLLD
ncbi:BTB/POZ domain-containing protein 9 [Camelus dromedarius]|uniref:BTB/POZ domain-containing protein 9 n=1 Tax=Camelus dromedarius TaxID=9838 RepID=A0A5N4CS21_CAMDR|nr:BTB/POZ domain-containing protein 9 [Camelus dromedarius]